MKPESSVGSRFAVLLGFGLAFVAILVCSYGIYYLSVEVRKEVDRIAVANSDNTQWSLAQNELELLHLIDTVHHAAVGKASLDQVRQKFDILYSRIKTFKQSAQFNELRANFKVSTNLAEIQRFLDAQVLLIDADDASLLQGLENLGDQAEELRPLVREISMEGLNLLSERADLRRSSASRALGMISLLTAVLIFELSATIGVLGYLFRQSRQRAEEQTAMAARLSTIVSTSLDAVIVLDGQGNVQEYNGAAEEIFGYSKQEVLGKAIVDIIVPEYLRTKHLAEFKRFDGTGESHFVGGGRVRTEARHQDGRLIPVEFSTAVAPTPNGRVFVSFVRDISMIVLAEQELTMARDKAVQGEKAKAELLAVMSHEMRTPLNGMLGTLELLNTTPLTPTQERFVRIIQNSGQILLNHVNDVLDISRLDAGRMDIESKDFDLRLLVDDLVGSQEPLAQSGGNSLSVIWHDPNLQRVQGDAKHLRQILFNLVGNAIKFTRDGRIRLEIACPAPGKISFDIIDTGIGIAPENLERIFEDFVTIDRSYMRKAGGTGLGLGITLRLVKAMAGEIKVDSILGEGSTFRVTLPWKTLAEAKPVSEPRSKGQAKAVPQWPDKDILVVEDNHTNRFVVNELLKRCGCKVDEARNGKEGVAMATAKRYDLILMDISMPEMDGVTAASHIRASDQVASFSTPIIALTAHAMADELERFAKAGMPQTITKPLTAARLQSVLADHFDRGTALTPPS